jgi:hypothetical protein
MEKGSGKRYSSAGSEKVEKDGDRQKKMEGHCSTGQSSYRAVVPVEEEEEEYTNISRDACIYKTSLDIRLMMTY